MGEGGSQIGGPGSQGEGGGAWLSMTSIPPYLALVDPLPYFSPEPAQVLPCNTFPIVAYITSCDGCISFYKRDWSFFASRANQKMDDRIFIFFRTSNKAKFKVNVVVTKL